MIPLDKNAGVRPVEVGKVFIRIIGEVIGWVLKVDIHEITSALKTATGLQGGAEAAIHVMKNIFKDKKTEAVIVLDANNAFNLFNCMVATTCKC